MKRYYAAGDIRISDSHSIQVTSAPNKLSPSDRFRRRQRIFLASVLGLCGIIAGAVVLALRLSNEHYSYVPSKARVTNPAAFESGGATTLPPAAMISQGSIGFDVYHYYSGNASQFPNSTQWMAYDAMWKVNLHAMERSCSALDMGEDDSASEIADIYDAIQNRAKASLVDPRLILAVLLQESRGCVRVRPTTSHTGVRNPGLMQSHNGHSFSASHQNLSILAMVQDGTQGTKDGAGLVQYLNTYGNPYRAVRAYNSGYIPASGNLSVAAGATACYVSDVANRMTGWVNAKTLCME